MEDMAAVTGKLMPPALTRRTMNSKRGLKQTRSQQVESADSFEATAAGSSREVSVLLSKFAEALSERAAADTSQMEELEDILTEAENLETSLKEKKAHLRQTLALISDKLQG